MEDVPAFDLLCGTDSVRKGLESGAPLRALVEGFDDQARAFEARRAPFLLYA